MYADTPKLPSLPTRRSSDLDEVHDLEAAGIRVIQIDEPALREGLPLRRLVDLDDAEDRKSTRLNSSHANISYAVFRLKKKNRTGQGCSSRVSADHGGLLDDK